MGLGQKVLRLALLTATVQLAFEAFDTTLARVLLLRIPFFYFSCSWWIRSVTGTKHMFRVRVVQDKQGTISKESGLIPARPLSRFLCLQLFVTDLVLGQFLKRR